MLLCLHCILLVPFSHTFYQLFYKENMIYREVFKFTKQVLKFAWKLLEEKQSDRDINSSKWTR